MWIITQPLDILVISETSAQKVKEVPSWSKTEDNVSCNQNHHEGGTCSQGDNRLPVTMGGNVSCARYAGIDLKGGILEWKLDMVEIILKCLPEALIKLARSSCVYPCKIVFSINTLIAINDHLGLLGNFLTKVTISLISSQACNRDCVADPGLHFSIL